jgi:hypothetical protein
MMASIWSIPAPSWSYFLLWFSFWFSSIEAQNSTVDLKSILLHPSRGWSAGTDVIFPSSALFSNATERWTIFNPPTYRAAIRPDSDDEISKLVCRKTRLREAYRGFNIDFVYRSNLPHSTRFRSLPEEPATDTAPALVNFRTVSLSI